MEGRFHDTSTTLITELAKSGAGDQTIMDIAGHVSRQMLARYSHIRTEAKRRALEGVGTGLGTISSTKLEEDGHKNGHNPSGPQIPVVANA